MILKGNLFQPQPPNFVVLSCSCPLSIFLEKLGGIKAHSESVYNKDKEKGVCVVLFALSKQHNP